MSALDRGGVVVTAYPSKDVVDPELGGRRREAGDPDSEGVEVYVWIVRPRSDTILESGYDTTEKRQLVARSFPFGAKTVVRHEGRLWDVIDEPLARRVNPRTTHTTCAIEARTGAAR